MKLVAAILFCLLIVLQLQLWFGSHGYLKLRAFEQTIDQERRNNDELAERNNRLHEKVQELKEGKDALEEKARSQLGMIKEGETFYRIVPENSAKEEPSD
jgi:cell division protein FtsB